VADDDDTCDTIDAVDACYFYLVKAEECEEIV